MFFAGGEAFVGDGALLGAAGALAFLATHFFDGLGFGGGAAFADGFELVAEFAAGEETVEFAGAIDLALDGDAGGEVLEEDAIGGFVDLLAAGAGAADEFFQQLVLVNAEGGHPRFEGGLFLGGERVVHGGNIVNLLK